MVTRFNRGVSASRAVAVAIPILIAVATIVAFIPALRNGFVAWDDETNFIHNLNYRGLGADHLRWMWTTTLMGHYVPLSWMTLGFDYDVWGMNAAGYHFTSMVIHAANAILVYFVAIRCFEQSGSAAFKNSVTLMAAAAAAALGFSLHPLRVESVAWATERRDVVSCFFFLASILSYLRFAGSGTRDTKWYAGALLLFVASLLSKATSMTLPAVLVLLNVYPLKRLDRTSLAQGGNWRTILKEVAPFLALTLGAGILSIFALHPPDQLSIPSKLAVSAYSLGFYVWKTLLPVRLSPLYEMPLSIDPFAPRLLLGYAVVVVVSIVVWLLRRRYPAAGIAWIAFVIITSPMLGVVQNGPQIAADRYTYYSAATFSILGAGWLFSSPRIPMRGALLVSAALLGALGTVTWKQTSVWRDSSTLWNRVLSLDDASSFAHVGLARLDFDSGDMEGAIAHYRRASELLPTYSEGYNNIGNAMAREGRLDEAIEQYQHALAIKSAYPEVRNNWGSVLARQGKFSLAIEQFQLAIALKPAYAEAHSNLGAALARSGNLQGAEDEFARALAIDSTYADAQINWANALARGGQPELAGQHYAAALRLRPGDVNAHLNWGAVLAQQGDLDAAILHFQRAVELDPNNADARADLQRAVDSRASTAARRP